MIPHLAETLLHVFVSIEMTGQSVQFEQKFNYRRPMYLVLDYIWEMEIHQKAIEVIMPFLIFSFEIIMLWVSSKKLKVMM